MKRHHPWLSWPSIRKGPMLVACHLCDTLQTSPRLQEGDGAYCCACGELLYRNRRHSLARTTSYSAAALIFMGVAHTFPILTMSSGGISNHLTLGMAASVLIQDGRPLLGAAVILFTIAAPIFLLGGLLYLSAPLLGGRSWPGARMVARVFQRFEPWSMQEVFLLGLVVSLLKLVHLADLQLGVGLWALAGAVFFTAAAMSGIDRMELWDRLELTHHHLS